MTACGIAKAKAANGAVHVMGLLSPGGVHSHQDHIAALARIVAEAGLRVHVHAFLDGRDTPPRSAEGFVATFENAIAGHANGNNVPRFSLLRCAHDPRYSPRT